MKGNDPSQRRRAIKTDCSVVAWKSQMSPRIMYDGWFVICKAMKRRTIEKRV